MRIIVPKPAAQSENGMRALMQRAMKTLRDAGIRVYGGGEVLAPEGLHLVLLLERESDTDGAISALKNASIDAILDRPARSGATV
jgi:hypothetical protein